MSICNPEIMPALQGKTVAEANAGKDDAGYGFVTLHFTDGTFLKVFEHSQTGELKIRTNGPPVPSVLPDRVGCYKFVGGGEFDVYLAPNEGKWYWKAHAYRHLPVGDPVGPFNSSAEAYLDATQYEGGGG